MVAKTEPTPEPSPEVLRNSTSLDVEKAAPAPPKQESEDEFPSFQKLIFILVALYLSMFIVALVRKPSSSL